MKENSIDQTAATAYPRRATVEDLPDIAQIHRLAFSAALPHLPVLHTPSEDLNFFSTAVYPSAEIWLLELSGVTAGFIAFRPGWVDHLYIHPGCQRRRLGSSLLALAQARSDSLQLWTFQCNLAARHFYEKHGFQIARETDGAGNEEKQPDILYVWQRESAAPDRDV